MSTHKKRKEVLKDTIVHSITRGETLHNRAKQILTTKGMSSSLELQKNIKTFPLTPKTFVAKEDWGYLTSHLTSKYKTNFVVLNCANAFQPGGGYWEGCPAQEENMWFRSDAHVLHAQEINVSPYEKVPRYESPLTKPFLAKTPRVCFKTNNTFEPCVPFEFYELRQAAIDTRHIQNINFDLYKTQMRAKIKDLFQCLIDNNKKHVVLTALGCGAFANKLYAKELSKIICQLFKEEINIIESKFDVIAFAIYYPGYGVDNYKIWRQTCAS